MLAHKNERHLLLCLHREISLFFDGSPKVGTSKEATVQISTKGWLETSTRERLTRVSRVPAEKKFHVCRPEELVLSGNSTLVHFKRDSRA